MIPSIPSSQALFVIFLFATTFLWTFPENVVATSKHGSVTRHYKFDVRILLFFLHILAHNASQFQRLSAETNNVLRSALYQLFINLLTSADKA